MMQFTDTYRHKGLRQELKRKLTADGIKDEKVLEAIATVPRHMFFGLDTIFYDTQAYEDKAFPIGEGQTISQPFTVAYQTQLLEVKPNEKILEIGTGSGYQATVLMYLQANVHSIERQRNLYQRTRDILPKIREFLLQTANETKVREGRKGELVWYWPVKTYFTDGFLGLPGEAPFDKILITAAVGEMPEQLLRQLKIGGVLVMPYGESANCEMSRITRISEHKYEKEVFDTFAFVPMLKNTANGNENRSPGKS